MKNVHDVKKYVRKQCKFLYLKMHLNMHGGKSRRISNKMLTGVIFED